MKIEIKYNYDANCAYPYTAKTTIQGIFFMRASEISYAKAKEELIEVIRRQLSIIVPEPEEVEIET
jgi:hypothetical protein